jgi:orotate phosphoribosyltransferase
VVEADYYVDLCRATLEHGAVPLIGRPLRVLTADWEYSAVGGLALGEDRWPPPRAARCGGRTGRPPVNAFVVPQGDQAAGAATADRGPGHRRTPGADLGGHLDHRLGACRGSRRPGGRRHGGRRGRPDTGPREAIEADGLLGLADLDLT